MNKVWIETFLKGGLSDILNDRVLEVLCIQVYEFGVEHHAEERVHEGAEERGEDALDLTACRGRGGGRRREGGGIRGLGKKYIR
jgi:hypothetical protein